MMISDKERREVARKLREVTEEELCHMFLGEILGCFIGGCCCNEEDNVNERLVLNRLADLIEANGENYLVDIAEAKNIWPVYSVSPENLTHERFDSWERIDEDLEDIVRRAKELLK